jgi:hypothetical protein
MPHVLGRRRRRRRRRRRQRRTHAVVSTMRPSIRSYRSPTCRYSYVQISLHKHYFFTSPLPIPPPFFPDQGLPSKLASSMTTTTASTTSTDPTRNRQPLVTLNETSAAVVSAADIHMCAIFSSETYFICGDRPLLLATRRLIAVSIRSRAMPTMSSAYANRRRTHSPTYLCDFPKIVPTLSTRTKTTRTPPTKERLCGSLESELALT